MPDTSPAAGPGIYECGQCGERLIGERRCPDCNLFAAHIGTGGCCPSCGDTITITEILEAATN